MHQHTAEMYLDQTIAKLNPTKKRQNVKLQDPTATMCTFTIVRITTCNTIFLRVVVYYCTAARTYDSSLTSDTAVPSSAAAQTSRATLGNKQHSSDTCIQYMQCTAGMGSILFCQFQILVNSKQNQFQFHLAKTIPIPNNQLKFLQS